MAVDNSWQPMAAASISAGVDLKTTNKMIAAQKAENEAMRSYNAQQAAKKNEWNIQQWNRENAALRQATAEERAFNSPAAQKARLEAAGLNADMMYGQGGITNTSSAAGVARSPEMVNSDYGAPMDWSIMNGYKSVGQTVMNSLAIAQARANVKKTEAEARSADVTAQSDEKYGLTKAELSNEYVREQINYYANMAESVDYSNTLKSIEKDFAYIYREDIIKNYLQRLRTSTGLSENDLKEDIETLTLRIAGINAENSRLDRMSNFTTEEWRLVFDVVKELFSVLK